MKTQEIYSCFKAYDIRGKVPVELDEELCEALGFALSSEFAPKNVVVGRDVRHSGPALSAALTSSLLQVGVNVTDIGICGTEEVYFAAANKGFDLGIMFTASHNPAEYNGIKLVRAGAVPISGDSGLIALRNRILQKNYSQDKKSKGSFFEATYRHEYIKFLHEQLNLTKEFKVIMNPGNGCAGPVLSELLAGLPGEFIIIQGEPDGSFPNGIPNPLLPERRADTAKAVRLHKAELGLAWDGDFDRCFFYDSDGNFIESYYLIGALAQNVLKSYPGSKIIHDTRLIWNTIELVTASGGIPVQTKTGHAFMKERLRQENAVYGGEMSAHHYFRDFSFCDSGMLPWIKMLELLQEQGIGLAELVHERTKAYPCSGEINFTVHDAKSAVEHVHKHFIEEIKEENHIDGLSADCGNWRFNLRTSNTEPLLRLNIEARGDIALMQDKTAEISELLEAFK